MDIGARIREARKSAKLTQQELARKLGVSRTTVTMWETEKNTPPTRMLPAIAEIMGCSVDELLFRAGA